ncbi:MAG: HAMP domain-containing histidine kinase [Desulfobacteraceae bacterium]|nr:HAMP domain-containing histidine kinase [Desulfobacteraceae bacterium]
MRERVLSDFSGKPDAIESSAKPFKIAILVSAVFFAAGVVYILLSSHIAALAAATVPDLASIEKTKGFLFIVFTTLLLFFVIYVLMLKIDRQQRRLLNFGNRLIAAERRAAAVVLADSVSREIGNVLMNVEYYCSELEEAVGGEKTTAVNRINEARTKLNTLARRLGNVARHLGEESRDFINLPVAVKDALGFASRHRRFRFIRLNVEAPDELMFMGNLLLIYQMVINLVMNAAEAAGSNGNIRVRLFEQDDFAVVQVHDSGPGIEQSLRETVMEPFYTTKENGNGLGLLSVRACAEVHQGKVEISESDLGGACFSVLLKKTPPVIYESEK